MCYPGPWFCSPSSLPRIPQRASVYSPSVFKSALFSCSLRVLCMCLCYSAFLIPDSFLIQFSMCFSFVCLCSMYWLPGFDPILCTRLLCFWIAPPPPIGFLVYWPCLFLTTILPDPSINHFHSLVHLGPSLVGRCGSGGRAVVWQSEGCRFDPTLGVSKCPWARHLTPNCSWWAGWYLAW